VHYVDAPATTGDSRAIGVLYLDSRERGTLLSDTARTALETLAAEAAVAIENARLYREASEKALRTQSAAPPQQRWRRRLETGGMIVGLFPDAGYEQATVQLAKGDLLTLFSDGVSEALNAAGEEFGEDRIRSTIAAPGCDSTDALLQTLLAAVRQFALGAVQNDDVTAMVIKYLG